MKGASLECGALAPLWYQSANKLAHSKEALEAVDHNRYQAQNSVT